MNTYGNIHFSETAKNLLAQYRQTKITFEAFLIECAYWVLHDGFDELTPLLLPIPPNTVAWNEYEALVPTQKLKVDFQFFYKNPEINEYYHQVFFIKQHNKHILEWLREIKNYLPPEDEINLRKIDNRIIEFLGWFDDNPIQAEKLKKIFQARKISHKNFSTTNEIINNALF